MESEGNVTNGEACENRDTAVSDPKMQIAPEGEMDSTGEGTKGNIAEEPPGPLEEPGCSAESNGSTSVKISEPYLAEDDSNSSGGILDEESKRLTSLNLPTNKPKHAHVEVDEVQREKQYKNLIDLLSKSKFYTSVLLQKIESGVGQIQGRKRKTKDVRSSPLKEDNCDKEKTCSPHKKKRMLLAENRRAMYEIASEVMKNKQTSENTKGTDSATEEEGSDTEKPEVTIEQPSLLTGGTLRDYQLEGFNWLKVLFENGVNGILADEMGLGKTVQVIALLSHLIEMRVKGPFLIIGPLSTLPNWVIEFERFAPKLPVILYHASKGRRDVMRESLHRKHIVNGYPCYPIVVTSYEIPIMDRYFMAQFNWKYIIVDEGHRLKNHNTILAKVLRSFTSANRLLLTGTPLHNSLSELWSLLNFLVPEIFDNLEIFESWFHIEDLKNDAGRKKIIEEQREKNVIGTLHQILSPFMLRREKCQVALELPKKKEVLVYASMPKQQFELYRAVLNKDFAHLTKEASPRDLIIPDVDGKRPKRRCAVGKTYKHDDSDITFEAFDNIEEVVNQRTNGGEVKVNDLLIRVKMSNQMQILRLIANHPYLVHYPLQEDGQSFLIDENVVKASGKLLVLDALLSKLHERGHKVLLFSSFTMLLDILEDYLSLRSYNYERLDGSVAIENRAASIKRFNSDPNVFLFLISTRAGGLGINLTAADTVIFYDSDWNPQVDLQAQDRCHRIGQTRPVMVYRLVTKGSIDERMLERAGAKRALEKLIIHKGTVASNHNQVLDLDELRGLLESRDHTHVVHTDSHVITDSELDKLLDRSDMLD